MRLHRYLAIGRGVPTAEGASDHQQQLLMLQVGAVVLLHAHHLEGGKTTSAFQEQGQE